MYILRISEVIVSLLIGVVLWYLKINVLWSLLWIPFSEYFRWSMATQKEKFWLFSFIRLIRVYFTQKKFNVVFGIILGLLIAFWYLKLTWQYFLLTIPVSLILDIFRYFLYNYGKLHYMDERCKNLYNGKIKVLDNVDGILTVNSKIPLNEMSDKKTLELVINSTILSITQDLKYKYKFRIKHESGTYSDYRHRDKISADRLELILKQYGDTRPILKQMTHGEVNDKFSIVTTIGKKRLIRLMKDIEYKLGCKKNTLSIEIDEDIVTFVVKRIDVKNYYIDDVIMDTPRPAGMKIPFVMGINKETGKALVYDYKHIGHMIIAGMTGSGKSSVLHALLYTLMYWCDEIVFYMFDLKGSELPGTYGNFINCKVSSINDGANQQEAIEIILRNFQEVEKEYGRRQRLFSELGVKDIDGYNRVSNEKMPYILIVIDEANALYELIKKKNSEAFNRIECIIDNLCARGRNAGMWQLHTMQQLTKDNYSISWRRSAMTRVGLRLMELRSCQLLFEGLPEVAEEERNLFIGEYIITDNKNNIFRLQNTRVKDDLSDLTYQNLKEVYGNVLEQETRSETDCGSENIS